MLGPHPRVRLNGVARPLPKLRFGRGTPCVSQPKSGIKKLHNLGAGGGGKRAFSEISGGAAATIQGQSAPLPVLGPHPRVRLNGVARPLPKLRFGRGTPCVSQPKSGIKKLHDLGAGGGGKRAFSEISGGASATIQGRSAPLPVLGPLPRVRLNGVARPPPKLRFGRGSQMLKPAKTRPR